MSFVSLLLAAISLVVAIACSSNAARETAGAGSGSDAPPALVAGASREPGDPPLVLACRNQYFSGTAPVDLATADGGLVVISARNEHLHVARVDLQGRVLHARSAGIREKVMVPTSGDTEPLRAADGTVHFTCNNPDARLVDVQVDASGKLVGHEFLTPAGPLHGGRGARTVSTTLTLRWDDRGPDLVQDGRQVADLYDAASLKLVATVDPDCSLIESVVATDWGFALECALATEAASDPRTAPEDFTRTIVGVVDGEIAWRSQPLGTDGWWAALGTDGQTVLVVQSTTPKHPSDDDGRPFPVRSIRLGADGKAIGEPVTGLGRVPARYESLRLVWTGKEYAAIEWQSITRFDSHGRPLGTWRWEPDCAREYDDAKLIWTGEAYAVCGWYRTVFDKDDPDDAEGCKLMGDKNPAYPNLVYDPAEAERSAEIE